MDPAQQQILTELRALREEVKELHSKISIFWGVFWLLLLIGICAQTRSGGPLLVGGGILAAVYCFDRFILRKPKPEISNSEI